MSEATERLLDAWTLLAEDAAASVLGLCDYLHGPTDESETTSARKVGRAKKSTAKKGATTVAPGAYPGSFPVSLGGACQPAYAGAGAVHVGMQPQGAPVHLQPVNVQRVEPGQTKMVPRPNPAGAQLSPGLDQVEVAIDPMHDSVGLYWGRVRDTTGVVDSPFLIYIDGLP